MPQTALGSKAQSFTPLKIYGLKSCTGGLAGAETWPRRPNRRSEENGCVANFAQEVVKGQLPLSVGELGGQRVEPFGRCAALASLCDHHLSFLDHVHEFDPNQRVLGCLKRLEPEHGAGDPLHTPVVLFHDVV